MAYAAHTGTDEQVAAEPDASRQATMGLNAEQIQKLLSLVKVPKTGENLSGNGDWLLDSRANCHMTGDVSKLSKINDIHPILVNMPNGKTSMASKLGMVRLNSKILLHDVLFVPDLTCNLISITQLINDLVCIVIFAPKLCDTGPFLEDAD